MRLHRFYIKNELTIDRPSIEITDPKLLHQWKNVFRLGKGDIVRVFNNSGKEFEATIADLWDDVANLLLTTAVEVPEQGRRVHLFASLIKKDRFEWVVEKATELGVTSITPVVSSRSQIKNINIDRCATIAIEAAEQSGRVSIPLLNPIVNLSEVHILGKGIAFEVRGESIEHMKEASKKNAGELSIFIGPEGGWSEEDLAVFKEKGIHAYSLGSQVLRAETAAVATLAIILL